MAIDAEALAGLQKKLAEQQARFDALSDAGRATVRARTVLQLAAHAVASQSDDARGLVLRARWAVDECATIVSYEKHRPGQRHPGREVA